jgi:hypothetical protein
VKETEIILKDRHGKEVVRQKSSLEGSISAELPEYTVYGSALTYLSPYIIAVGKKETEVELKKNSEIDLVIK